MAQQQCEVRIPDNVLPGQKFIATTPDGQAMEVEVPFGATSGSQISFFYTPLGNCETNEPLPTVVGQPVIGQVVMGGSGGISPDSTIGGDQEAASMGWVLYAIGWFMCCCCGPVGLIFWAAVPCMFICKSKTEQRNHPKEKVVAMVNCITCAVCTVLGVLVLVYIIVLMATGSVEDETCEADVELNDGCKTCSYSTSGEYFGRRRYSRCWN
uniref:Uncharacterized protein n=1 Tax=Noctiluca scintillans TaxID=2966 RepID=A0A7S1FEW1_NOCSC